MFLRAFSRPVARALSSRVGDFARGDWPFSFCSMTGWRDGPKRKALPISVKTPSHATTTWSWIPSLSRVNLRHTACARRCGVLLPRHAIAAKIRVLRRPPESTRAGFGVGEWRTAGADTRMRPPGHWHGATVDRVQPAVGMPPKDAVRATRSNRQRGGGDALAAPLSAPRLRPVRSPFRAVRRLRGVATAQALISLSACARRRSQRNSVAERANWSWLRPGLIQASKRASCVQGYLSIPNLDFAASRNLDPNPIVVSALVALEGHKRGYGGFLGRQWV